MPHPKVVPAPPVAPQNLLGILLIAIGFFAFSAADTAAKYLTSEFHAIQIVWIRQFGMLIGAVLLLIRFGPGVARSRRPRLQIIRGVLSICSAILFVVAIAYAPLADAVAVSFVAPFFVTVLGAIVLRERVGFRRWTAIAIGFAATLIVIRPGTDAMHPAVSLVLLAAFFFALRQIVSRQVGAVDPIRTTVFYSAVVGVGILTVPLVYVWESPTTFAQIGLMIVFSAIAGFGEYLVIRALSIAEAVAVAPVHYSLIIWGTIWGFAVFGDLPDLWTWVGSIIIVATGLYTFNRERMAVKRQTAMMSK